MVKPARGERRIACTRGQVNDQVIQLTPFYITQKLTNGRIEHRSAPDKRLTGFHEQAHRDHLDAICNRGDETLSIRWREFFHAEHSRCVWSVDVCIQESDARAALSKRHRNIHS